MSAARPRAEPCAWATGENKKTESGGGCYHAQLYFACDRPLSTKLNAHQRDAVRYLDGPLLVVAGAGSGKTGVITRKIAYLIREADYAARTVFAITFTNKAAREMAERSRRLLGRAAGGLTVSTFHRLGLDILHKEYGKTGLRKGFSIFDARDTMTLLRELTKSEDEALIRGVQQRISRYKNAGLSPARAQSLAADDIDARAANAYGSYEERLRGYNAVDFDDLLALPARLLRTDGDVRGYWQERVRYLLIDEYQDTNDCQYALLQLLSGAGAAFTAVGDDDQSIYAWRGAQPENLANLHRDYPRLKTIKLERNYRCHRNILEAANALIENNPHIVTKRLWSNLDVGEGVSVICAGDEESEAERVVNDICARRIRTQAKPSDFAILYRGNFQSRVLEQQLRERNLAYTISGGTGFYEHAEIRDLLSYLRLIANPEDDAAFLRVCNVPKREIGPATLLRLGRYAGDRRRPLALAARELGARDILGETSYQHVSRFAAWLDHMQREAENCLPGELLARVIDDIDYESHLHALYKAPYKVAKRLERITQLQGWIARLQEDERYRCLDGLMRHLILLDVLERREQNPEAVQLMTLHSAKGLEFPCVYLVGVEEGLLPHVSSSETEAGIAEERRLMYVGMTRAKQTLTLSYARKRRRNGQWQESERSRFLDELPEHGVNWYDGSREKNAVAIRKQSDEMFAALHEMFRNS